jgi:hypothetical protein
MHHIYWCTPFTFKVISQGILSGNPNPTERKNRTGQMKPTKPPWLNSAEHGTNYKQQTDGGAVKNEICTTSSGALTSP